MADLRIVDAPEIPKENITGEEKLPTGGNGNYSISLDSLADYTKTKKDLVDTTAVDSKVNGVRQELDAHIEDLINPHQVTKGQIGLGNVDNTADADKPVSNSTQAAIISAVSPKADKTYVDTALSSKAEKTYVDNQIALKANKADVYTKSETYKKQESDDLVNNSISTALTPVNNSLDSAKRGIANRYDSSLTYNSGERVVLTNGDIVKSTIDGNANNPNSDMTGWFLIGSDKVSTVESVEDLTSLKVWDGRTVRTKSYHNGLGKGGALYVYDSTKKSTNNNVKIINGWVLQDKISVYRAGAYGDGTTDDTAYFQRAIDYSTYNKRNVDSSIMNNLLPASTNIVVDSGNYVLSDYLKTRSNMVVWDTADNVNFVGADNVNTKYLCGLVKRGDKISRIDNLGGTYDNAAPLSVINNAGKERSAGLQGYPAPHLIQKYDGGEQVGIFIDTHVENPFVVSSDDITYTSIESCTIRNATPALYAKLTVGTPIITQHTTPYKGQVKSIEYVDATTMNITLWGFYLSNPDVSDADATYDRVQPPAGFGAYFGYLKSAFGANITAWNENTIGQSALCGIELDMYNQATDENNDFELLNTPSSIGYYMANLGTKYIKFGFYGGWGNTRVMYMADSKYGQIDTAYMFRASASSYKQQNFFNVVKADNTQLFKVSYNAIELGSVSDADANVIDFHSSGFDNDYDARILVSGGASGIVQGNMTILAGSLNVGSSLLPETTNTHSLGSSSKTWSNIYSQNPVTVVSDKNAKNSIQAIDEKVLNAWAEVQPKQYKLNGDDSWSFGYIAQDVIEAFSKHGLDYKVYNIVHEEDGKLMLKYDMCAVLNSAMNRK